MPEACMKRTISFALIALVAGVAACGRGTNRSDSTLDSDLSLAAQQQKPIDSLNAAEHSAALAAPRQGVRHSAAGEVAHTRRATSSAHVQSSSGTVVEKHTNRDAAIGAAAGAVIGATTSHSKVKGGIIGGVIGGILGGVIGNNVDKTKKKPE